MITFLTDTEFKDERVTFSADAEELAGALARLKRTNASSVSFLVNLSLSPKNMEKTEVPQAALESLLDTPLE